MINYDDWKQEVPDDYDDYEYECYECGAIMYTDKTYCSKDCERASNL
jgi:hypothetical protein